MNDGISTGSQNKNEPDQSYQPQSIVIKVVPKDTLSVTLQISLHNPCGSGEVVSSER